MSMTFQKKRLDECDVGHWVKCSDATEVDATGSNLFLPSSSHPHRDLNTWKFERRLLSRLVKIPPQTCSEWTSDATLEVETFPVWTRVS